MSALAPFLLALVLLLLALGLAAGFLAAPMALLRRSGIVKAIRAVVRLAALVLRGLFRLAVPGHGARRRLPSTTVTAFDRRRGRRDPL